MLYKERFESVFDEEFKHQKDKNWIAILTTARSILRGLLGEKLHLDSALDYDDHRLYLFFPDNNSYILTVDVFPDKVEVEYYHPLREEVKKERTFSSNQINKIVKYIKNLYR